MNIKYIIPLSFFVFSFFIKGEAAEEENPLTEKSLDETLKELSHPGSPPRYTRRSKKTKKQEQTKAPNNEEKKVRLEEVLAIKAEMAEYEKPKEGTNDKVPQIVVTPNNEVTNKKGTNDKRTQIVVSLLMGAVLLTVIAYFYFKNDPRKARTIPKSPRRKKKS